MTLEQTARDTVEAVVVDDGLLLLVDAPNGWGLPSGPPEPAERPQATAARVVYELTGYLVDGSSLLEADGDAVEGRGGPHRDRLQLPGARAVDGTGLHHPR
ncbi:NUDIX domain-containing protein, partial [Streptomyces halstedii]|uniref:NUDIX domain-containing protein n=1 Tax=Streptomyces halstedii TaxID=1944 RepID=UPI003347328F